MTQQPPLTERVYRAALPPAFDLGTHALDYLDMAGAVSELIADHADFARTHGEEFPHQLVEKAARAAQCLLTIARELADNGDRRPAFDKAAGQVGEVDQ